MRTTTTNQLVFPLTLDPLISEKDNHSVAHLPLLFLSPLKSSSRVLSRSVRLVEYKYISRSDLPIKRTSSSQINCADQSIG